ncbi:MAG: hypothetical protein Q4A30_00805 [Candidatus Saccharibacteria bacterium]|nr:hypothetical protein [Candidatus Saccharibacteria bacterium]
MNTTISDTDSNGWKYKAIENTYYKNIVNQPSVSLSSSGVSGDTKELWSTVPPAGFSDFSKFEIQCTGLMGSGSGVVLRWQGGTDRLRLFARNTANYPNQDTGSWHAYIRLVKVS